MTKQERIIKACKKWYRARSGTPKAGKAQIIEQLAWRYPFTFAQLIADGKISDMWLYIWARGGCAPLPRGVNDIYKRSALPYIQDAALWWERVHGQEFDLTEIED